MSIEIVQAFCTNNDCYKANVNRIDKRYVKFQDEGPKGLMLHSVGCAQPDASVFVRRWNKPNYELLCHAVIDANSGIVMQTLPWNYRGWHCGSGKNGSGNNTHIGVEMCESNYIQYPADGSAKFVVLDCAKAQEQSRTAYNAAVQLFAMLCKEYNIDPMTGILSHNEGAKKGIASGHVDPEHYWSRLGLEYTMDGFRSDVAAIMNSEKPEPDPPKLPTHFNDVPADTWYTDAVIWAVDNGITMGTSSTEFSPAEPCTRAQVVTLLYRYDQYDKKRTEAMIQEALDKLREELKGGD